MGTTYDLYVPTDNCIPRYRDVRMRITAYSYRRATLHYSLKLRPEVHIWNTTFSQLGKKLFFRAQWPRHNLLGGRWSEQMSYRQKQIQATDRETERPDKEYRDG